LQSGARVLSATGKISVSAVLVDLDGTLIDTAPDMANALNQLLVEEGQSPLRYELIRPHVSRGAEGLLKLAWADIANESRFSQLRQRFLDIYAAMNGQESVLFDGFGDLLDRLESAGIAWGIVTNKPAWLSEPLIEGLKIDARIGCLVCGDTLNQRKPHPAPLLHASSQLKAEPRECVYIGDARRDMEAAERANMRGIAAAYGYIPEDSDPATWPAAAIIEKPGELVALFGLV